MRDEYYIIFGRLLKEKREQANITLRQLEEIVSLSFSQISKIENARVKTPVETMSHIIDVTGFNIIVNKDRIAYFEGLFDSLYQAILLFDDNQIIDLVKNIEKDKEDILNSLCKYKYYLYKVLLEPKYKRPELEDEVFKLSNLKECFSVKDWQILSLVIGSYYILNFDRETGYKYYVEATFYREGSIEYANAHLFLGINLFKDESLIRCLNCIDIASKIYEDNFLAELYTICNIVKADIYSKTGDFEAAIAKYMSSVTKTKHLKRLIFNRIMICAALNPIDDVVDEVRSVQFEYEEDNYLAFLFYLYMKSDKESFNRIYKEFQEKYHNQDVYNMIALKLKDSFGKNEKEGINLLKAYDEIKELEIFKLGALNEIIKEIESIK